MRKQLGVELLCVFTVVLFKVSYAINIVVLSFTYLFKDAESPLCDFLAYVLLR